VLFVTGFEECAIANANGSKILRNVWDLSRSVLLSGHHCLRDRNSFTRVIAAWETLKRRNSILNVDPDVVFIKPFPDHIYDSDFSWATYYYLQSQVDIDRNHINMMLADIGVPSLFQSINFGTWFWNSSPQATLTFAAMYVTYLWDIQGKLQEAPIFLSESEAVAGLAISGQNCDDQLVAQRFSKELVSQSLIKDVSFGLQHRQESENGVLHSRFLQPTEMVLAMAFIRSSDQDRRSRFHGMHMSTFGIWR
jgi:hypothetical protein